MNEQTFKKLVKKQQEALLTEREAQLLRDIEDKHLESNHTKVFTSSNHYKNLKKEIQINVTQRTGSRNQYVMWSAAASIILLCTIGMALYFKNVWSFEKQEHIAQIVKTTTFGQKLNIVLPDGSKVKLNAGSKIEYPEHFSDTLREVKLIGEAFFDVVHNPEKPFIVKTGTLITKVLGTSFNIEAYEDLEAIKVTLATGKVALSNNSESATLSPSEQAVFNRQKQAIAVRGVNITKYIEWKDGVLRFENAPLKDIVTQLERWYNVDIVLDAEKNQACHFTGTYKNQSLRSVLKSLMFSNPDMSYQYTEENKIKISGTCNE